MRILFILCYGWEFGGGETYTRELKKYLINKGHTVKIFSSNNNPNFEHFSDYEFNEINIKPISSILSLFNPISYLKLKNVLKEYKPEIVHIQAIDNQVTSSILLPLKNENTLMTFHSASIFPIGSNLYTGKMNKKYFDKYLYEKIKYRITSFLLHKYVKQFIVPSLYFKNVFENEKFNPISVIHLGIKIDKKIVKDFDNKSILYIGRLEEEKGVIYLIKAMRAIVNKIPDCRLTIIGDGQCKGLLLNSIHKFKLENNIIIKQKIPHFEVNRFYKKSSLLIIPSVVNESFGLVGLEAMSAGIPVIASRVGGIPEWLVDGKTGYLVKPANSKQIAKKVIYLLSNKELIKRMGENARKRAKQFSIEKHVKEIENVYMRVIEKTKL